MPRYFVAIPLPDDVKDRLIALQPPATAGMRHIGRDEFHLTLHFLGDVAPLEIDKVRAALATIRTNAFTIALKGIGQFPPEGQAKVLWVGVEVNAELMVLHRSIGVALADAMGFRPEERPYSPHVTLARINDPAPFDAVDNYLERNKGFVLPSVRLDRFALYSSEFTDNVPKYEEDAVFPLIGSEQAMAANFAQHREYPKRTLVRCALTNSVAGGTAILFFYLALSFNWAIFPAALAGALFLYILFFTPFVIVDSRRVRVVPYFSKQVPGTDTFASGNAIWKNYLFLNQFAKDKGIVPLAEFFSEDDLEDAEVVWHDPAEGAKTISRLLAELRMSPALPANAESVILELGKIEAKLLEASKNGSRFCFLFRHGSGWSLQEMSLRKGVF